jgi:hypothetical protein
MKSRDKMMGTVLQTIERLFSNMTTTVVGLIGGKPLTKDEKPALKMRRPSENRLGKKLETSSVPTLADPIDTYFRPIEAFDLVVQDMFDLLSNRMSQLAHEMTQSASQGGRTVFVDRGTLDSKRRFLFLKPLNGYGLLLELTPVGWRMSTAQRVRANNQDIFTRSSEDPLEVAIVMRDDRNSERLYIQSERFRQTLLPWTVYLERLTGSVKGMLTSQ